MARWTIHGSHEWSGRTIYMATKSAMDVLVGPVVAGNHLRRDKSLLRKTLVATYANNF